MQDVFGCTDRMVSHEELCQLDVAQFGRWTRKEIEDIDRFLVRSRARAESMVEEIRDRIDSRPRRQGLLKAAS